MKKKFEPKRCRTKFCRGRTTETGRSPYCHGCRHEHFKERSPLRYSFGNLRRRAKQRGHFFDLTFEQYEHFSLTTGYAALKGKDAKSLSIHRRDDAKGYTLSNITHCSLSLNSRIQWSNMPQWMKDEMLLHEQGKLKLELPPEADSHLASIL
jgi:hypothetical protein